MNFNINDFSKSVICEGGVSDTTVETVVDGSRLDLYLTATIDKPKFVELEWSFKSDEDLYVLGDVWERSYGDLEFKKLKDNNRRMPWYFIATDKQSAFCFGVKTGTNSFVSFTYTTDGIKALVDCRNGDSGVELKGRKIHLATFVYKKYDSSDVYENLCDYCKVLCDKPILTKERVYGGNNWYYAYGESSHEEILSDTALVADLCEGNENRPYMVIDDGWQPNRVCEVRYLGDYRFIVESVTNGSLRAGDTFSCLQFQLGKPLYMDCFEREGESTGQNQRYAVGRENGLTMVEIKN